ncbi:MAG TPA: DUF5916 domain-containing protein [Terriglobales bacterium]|nr:DUF5916 domain-containing protein [Terriglobales bacterium]
MAPEGPVARQMVKVTGFVQRNPHDGAPVSEPTDAYLGYDKGNLYVIFVCFDDPAKVRARRARREDIGEDDEVEIMLDTFQDQRRAYAFQTNPLGVQWDAIWTEASKSDTDSSQSYNHFDTTFDTLWYSRGRLTKKGFVVWMAIPFRSLRFTQDPQQSWGIILYRGIVRENEDSFWPALSSKVEGRLARAAVANGMEGIAPGRNLQFIPYGLFNSFRSLNTQDAANPHFDNRLAGGKIGLDSKIILKDSLVLDITGNPDFSQVESDDPQVTVNQRFEVFFPEKRPFFIENSDFFRTPIDLLFTRRIADPDFGTRLSGRAGHYGVGLLVADDKSPGEIVPPSDPEFGKRAYFAIGRLTRDVFSQSSVGAIFTDREFDGAFNRVGGLDARLKFSNNWTSSLQGVVTSTRNLDGSYQAGPGYKLDVVRSGLNLNYEGVYNDYSPGFVTEPGFVNRVDIREFSNTLNYRVRPKNGVLLEWGPTFQTDQIWDHNGVRLDSLFQPIFHLGFKRQTYINFEPYAPFRQRLRPVDFPTLPANRDYNQHFSDINAGTSFFKHASIAAEYNWGDQINFVPAGNNAPFMAFSDFAAAVVTLRPLTALKVDNTYLFSRLKDRSSGTAIFDNHIIRSRWNWQFNNELSLRFILQYDATLANPNFTFLQTTKQLSPQFLITYLVHPGTAVYVGYNSDLQNIDPSLALAPNGGLLRTRDRLINDNREFFVKISYLFRF